MFDGTAFRMTFGFFPSKVGDAIDEKIVNVVLAKLERDADNQLRSLNDLDQGYHSSQDYVRTLISKRSMLLLAAQVSDEAETRLRRACALAAKYGFQPVSRYQHFTQPEVFEPKAAPAV